MTNFTSASLGTVKPPLNIFKEILSQFKNETSARLQF